MQFSKGSHLLCFLFVLTLSSTVTFAALTDGYAFSKIPFDYVVVGGGTTGLAVAARLSDDPSKLVGVIEAGIHQEDNNILVPGMIGSTLGDPQYDWLLSTIPQPALNNRTVELGRGKLLGGTSALNFLGYSRASRNEYDGWQSLGNLGWDFDNFLEDMKRAETWVPPDELSVVYGSNNDSMNHGRSGPVDTTGYGNFSTLVPPFFSALDSLGVPRNNASHGGVTVGSWSITATMNAQNRSRSYAATAYYEPHASRQNLIVLTGAQAIKIDLSSSIDSTIRRATRVHYVAYNNVTYAVNATREIILSAGSLKTPQLLELSGIGNASLLESVGIMPMIDLPGVGENLQDHPGVVANFETFANMTTWDELSDPAIAGQQFNQYKDYRTGLYSSAASTVAFIPWESFMSPSTIQQIKSELDQALSLDPRYNRSTFSLQRAWLDDKTIPQLELILFPQSSNKAALSNTTGQKFYTISALFEHHWSRGNVHITNQDGLASPRIDMQYLESPCNIDTKVFIQAMRFALKLSQTQPLLSLTSGVIGPALSATDDELVSWIKANLSTNYHIIGSAAMLPQEEGGVVDADFLVYGTSNLRVVDASIFPLHIATHPVATLYGIGERAALRIHASNQ